MDKITVKKYVSIVVIALYLSCSSAIAGDVVSREGSSLTFNRDNSVVGIKNGKLYAYVDLAGNAPSLRQLKADVLTSLVLDASVRAATEWWKAPRFARVNSGVIDIITILNKDEYAKADFSSAVQHGKIYLSYGKSGVTVDNYRLNFEGLLGAKFSK